jgi:cellulose synthase/poly-beta-1,6-N-acetylglucosamine synthase-like glycosyltransferase
MHAYYRKNKMAYQIAYLPDPLCWTEAPDSYEILSRQRNRWTRGTIECLKFHKEMFANPTFGVLGFISYPYWLMAEWLAPFIEAGGLLFFLIFAVLGLANWPFFFALLFLVYSFAILISTYAILIQDLTFAKYRSPKDIWDLFLTAIQEPFRYHPRVVKWAMSGNYDHFMGTNKGWGEMTRKGFKKTS